MYEGTSLVGERGQITLPKPLRLAKGILPKDRVVVKLEGEKIVVEKEIGTKEKNRLLEEGYKKLAAVSLKLEKEMKYVSKEADRGLDDY